jgi:hypothetical protein
MDSKRGKNPIAALRTEIENRDMSRNRSFASSSAFRMIHAGARMRRPSDMREAEVGMLSKNGNRMDYSVAHL